MNRLMKQHARKLYLGRMGLLYLTAATCLLLEMVAALLPDLLVDLLPVYSGTLLPSLLSIMVLGPLSIGFLRICCQIYLGRDTGFAQLFHFFTSPGRYGRAVVVILVRDLIQYLLVPLGQLVSRLGARVAEFYRPADILLTLAAGLGLLALTVFGFFWLLRMVLMPYLLIRDESAGVGHLLRESFRLMGGNGGRYLMLVLSFAGYYLLVALVYAITAAAVTLTLGAGDPLALITLPRLLEEGVLYLLRAILQPYFILTLVAFADTVLSGRMEEVRYRASLGGRFLTWEQLHWAMDRGIPPAAPGGSYPPGQWGSGPYDGASAYQPRQDSGQPPYTEPNAERQPWTQPAQPPQGPGGFPGGTPAPRSYDPQELQAQQNSFLLGLPMAPRRFFASAMASSYHNFTLDSLLPASGVYPFLAQAPQLLELVTDTWRSCQQEMNTHPQGSDHRVRQQHRRVISGTPIRVTATIQEQRDGTGYQIGLGLELSSQEPAPGQAAETP